MKIIILSAGILILAGCTQKPQQAEQQAGMAEIFPDYRETDIPVNIAPLNFRMKESCRKVYVEFKGSGGSLAVSGTDRIRIPEKKWHRILADNAGQTLSVSVFTKNETGWKQYRPFRLLVRDEPVDPYLVYRLIAPGYQVWSKMGIYQRSLTGFRQQAIVENTLFPGACMNCHSFKQNSPDQLMFHLRWSRGGTILLENKQIIKLNTKTDSTCSNCTYPYWHPGGNDIAFSVNNISQFFHAAAGKRIEVADSKSDLVVYDIRKNELLTCDAISSEENFETFPAFSSDGEKLIFCSARAQAIPEHYDQVKYNLCEIDFDAGTGTFGNQVDTLINAEAIGRSISFPRVSPDGRYLMFTMAAYGNFSIWHKDADLYLYDFRTKNYRRLDEVNSPDTESYHSWSSNSRWFVFSSRRIDGLYTRPYLAHIDQDGSVSKPFLLPQKDPDFYMDLMESFNIPEFVTGKVQVDHNRLERTVLGNKGIQVGYREM